jgi:hypothetical protein
MSTFSSFVFRAGEERNMRSNEWEGEIELWSRSPSPLGDEELVELQRPWTPRPLTPESVAVSKEKGKKGKKEKKDKKGKKDKKEVNELAESAPQKEKLVVALEIILLWNLFNIVKGQKEKASSKFTIATSN